MAIANTIPDSVTVTTVPQKSKSAFRTIAEVADQLKVEAHVLRFWETKFSKIQPLKMRGGRRYYRPEDIELIKTIKHLLYDKGFTIRGVQKILQRKGGIDALGAEVRLTDILSNENAGTMVQANNISSAKIVDPAIPVAANAPVSVVSGITEQEVQSRIKAAVAEADAKNIKHTQSQIDSLQAKINDLQSKLAAAEAKVIGLQNGIKPLLNELHTTRDLLKKTS